MLHWSADARLVNGLLVPLLVLYMLVAVGMVCSGFYVCTTSILTGTVVTTSS